LHNKTIFDDRTHGKEKGNGENNEERTKHEMKNVVEFRNRAMFL
jgi:hypothetical protein